MEEVVQMLNPQFGSEIQDAVVACQNMGISIEQSKKGFRCVDASFNTSTLTYRCGVPVHYIPQCSSTNTIARQYALDSSKAVQVVVTDFQTEGRGRLQRGPEPGPRRVRLLGRRAAPDPGHLVAV